MNDIEIYIVVEGQTEQTFVRDVLAPYVAYNGRFFVTFSRSRRDGAVFAPSKKRDKQKCGCADSNTFP